MKKQLPHEFDPFVEKIIDQGVIDDEECFYFKSLISKYLNDLDPGVTNLFEKIINNSKPYLPNEYRDKLLLYVSGMI